MRARRQTVLRSILCAIVTGSIGATFQRVSLGAQSPSPVVLPQGYVDTNYTLPTGCAPVAVGTVPSGGCKIITVGAGQNFQTALDQARRGDIIQLAANATFVGPYELPDKGAGTGWVYVISSNLGNLPGPGNRLNPNLGGTCGAEGSLPCGVAPNASLSDMPLIMSGGGVPSRWITTAHGADRYRFIGIEFRSTPGEQVTAGIRLHETYWGTPHSSLSQKTSDIIMDRCLMRGNRTAPYAGRAVIINGDRHAVVDSYLSDWVDDDSDTQAVLIHGYASVFAVINNYLEATGENVYTDNAETIDGVVYVPSDGEIRGNFLRKLAEWNSRPWYNTKNQFEMKSGQRILFEGNVIDSTWHLAQETAINIKIGDEDPRKFVANVTVRKNIIRHVANGIKMCATQCNSGNNTNIAVGIAVYNNIFDHVSDGVYGTGGDGNGFHHIVNGPMMFVDHNTFINSANGVGNLFRHGGVGPSETLVITNNIWTFANNPMTGAEVASASSIASYTNNLMVGGNCANFPAGNRCPASWAAVGFVNYNGGNGGDYTLSPGSAYKGVGADPLGVGTFDPGANVAAVNGATGCAVTGQCGGPQSGDTTPPSVSMTAPGNGANVSGTITLSADAFDDTGVAGVQFLLDGSAVGSEDQSGPYSVSWNTATTSNGNHTLTARARDAAGNFATSGSITVNVQNSVSGDSAPPAVSITVPGHGATVSGTTSVSASATDNVGVAGVQFLLDGANIGSEDTTAPYSVSWNTTTASNGAHALTARARDAAGNTTTSATVTITVQNSAPGDTTLPNVTVTGPANGSTVSGTINATASATDNVGVVGVQFLVDGLNLGAEDTTSPYSVSWPTASYTNGPHTLSARARDAAGNMRTSAIITVTVQNQTSGDTTPPTVSLTSPANGATVSGNVPVSASATDNVGVVGVQFRLDGQNLGPEIIAAPYAMTWNAAGSTPGSHTLTAIARDAAGNSRQATAIVVTVQNFDAGTDFTPPNVSMTTPANGSTVSGNVLLSANATDNVAVASVQFVIDGANFGQPVIAPPYTLTWDAAAVPAGSHVISAIARDAAGNSRSAVAVTVTVKSPGANLGAAPRGDVQRVSWTSLVNARVYLWRLRKTEGCDNCADAGAVSVQRVMSGNAYLEIEGTTSAKVYFIGWGPSSPGTSPDDLEFSIRFNGSSADVYEAGVPKAGQLYNSGDILRISVNGGVVTYSRNGTAFYTSQRAPIFPMNVRAVLMDRRAEVSRANFWRPTASAIAATGLNGSSSVGTGGAPGTPASTQPNPPSSRDRQPVRSAPTNDSHSLVEPGARPSLLNFDRSAADATELVTWAVGLMTEAKPGVVGIYLYAQLADGSTDEPVFIGAVSPTEARGLPTDGVIVQARFRQSVAGLAPGTYRVSAFTQPEGGAPNEIAQLQLVVR